MQANEYQRWTKRFDNHDERWLTPALALGLVAEAGEVANEIERSYRRPLRGLDVPKVADELGDVCWNVARLADELGYTLEDLMQMNVNKLIKRYDSGGIPMSPATDSSAAVVYEERGLPLND